MDLSEAEDSGAVVVRVYEAFGQRGASILQFGRAPKRVLETDMMEENGKVLKHKGNALPLYFTPYEIKTLLVEF